MEVYIILCRKRRIAAVMNILDRSYKTSFFKISVTEIFCHAIIIITCNKMFKPRHKYDKGKRNNNSSFCLNNIPAKPVDRRSKDDRSCGKYAKMSGSQQNLIFQYFQNSVSSEHLFFPDTEFIHSVNQNVLYAYDRRQRFHMIQQPSTCALLEVDLKKSPSSRMGHPREKQSGDLQQNSK